jgi:hypothetical protein
VVTSGTAGVGISVRIYAKRGPPTSGPGAPNSWLIAFGRPGSPWAAWLLMRLRCAFAGPEVKAFIDRI